eukprot:8146243-Karenia_brevis.AAC.1
MVALSERPQRVAMLSPPRKADGAGDRGYQLQSSHGAMAPSQLRGGRNAGASAKEKEKLWGKVPSWPFAQNEAVDQQWPEKVLDVILFDPEVGGNPETMWRSGLEGVDGEPRSKTIKQSNPIALMGEGASMPQLE